MSIRTMSVVGATLVLLASLPFKASAQRTSASGQDPKFVSLVVGETTRVAGSQDYFERVLLSSPELGKISMGNTWEISADVAIKLGRLSEEERWRVIRRNLGLAQDAHVDLVLWTEVVNAFFGQIKELPLEKDSKGPAFGLRVAFPGHDTSSNAKADVALTFNSDQTFDLDAQKNDKDAPKDFESRLNKKIVAALTGVEVFVNMDYGFSVSSDEAADILANLKLRLFDGSDKEFVPLHHTQSYFCFSPLPVDPEFGSDFRLRADMMEGYSYGGKKIDIMLTDPEGQYVPVRQGVRTRLNLNLTAIVRKEGLNWQEALEGYQKALKTKGGEQIPGAPAAISMLFQKFVAGNFLLGAIMQRLPANPGLHLGVVQINGSGLQPLWSVRLLLKSPELDRRPRFVSRGTIQLQCLTSASPEGMVQPHYIKIIWSGRADPIQLDLQARPIIESPWGFGAGVVPSVSPALYAVGASYKLFHVCEIFAGAGIRKDYPTSFVYGVTLDVENILGALFGKATSPEAQKSETSAEPSGQGGQKSKTDGTPAPSRVKSNKT